MYNLTEDHIKYVLQKKAGFFGDSWEIAKNYPKEAWHYSAHPIEGLKTAAKMGLNGLVNGLADTDVGKKLVSGGEKAIANINDGGDKLKAEADKLKKTQEELKPTIDLVKDYTPKVKSALDTGSKWVDTAKKYGPYALGGIGIAGLLFLMFSMMRNNNSNYQQPRRNYFQ